LPEALLFRNPDENLREGHSRKGKGAGGRAGLKKKRVF